MKKIDYKDYRIIQASNNHITIYKNNKMVFHANCTKKLTEKELKGQLLFFINLIKEGCEDDESNNNRNN